MLAQALSTSLSLLPVSCHVTLFFRFHTGSSAGPQGTQQPRESKTLAEGLTLGTQQYPDFPGFHGGEASGVLRDLNSPSFALSEARVSSMAHG